MITRFHYLCQSFFMLRFKNVKNKKDEFFNRIHLVYNSPFLQSCA